MLVVGGEKRDWVKPVKGTACRPWRTLWAPLRKGKCGEVCRDAKVYEMDGCSEGVEMDALVSLLTLIAMVVRRGSSQQR